MVRHSLALLLLSVVLYCADGLSVLPSQTFSPSRISSHATAYRPNQVSFTQQQQQCGRSSSATKIYSAAIAADAGDTNIKYGPAITIGKLKINIFGAIFGLWEVFWGVFYWYPMMTIYGLSRSISKRLPGKFDIMEKIDPYRRIPIMVAYTWGLISMGLFGLWPIVEGRENLEALRDDNGKLKSAMYVANHCSWMDIPYVCRVLGFRNCKMIAKAELLKVPILGRALAVAGHVTLDRTNRRSQMQAYKAGVQWLKDGVNLVTFPEGTRSKTSRLGSFKKGAFKMAQAEGATVVPMSIHYADKVQPLDYAFPAKPSRFWGPKAKIKVGKPISTDGKSDDDLLEEVWQAIADDLPESQKPTKDTPVGV